MASADRSTPTYPAGGPAVNSPLPYPTPHPASSTERPATSEDTNWYRDTCNASSSAGVSPGSMRSTVVFDSRATNPPQASHTKRRNGGISQDAPVCSVRYQSSANRPSIPGYEHAVHEREDHGS